MPEVSNIAAGFQVPQHTANPLQMLGQVVGIANALNQNRRENETFGAQQQIGRAFQGALNHDTGELDANAFRAAIANNPMAAFLAPQALAQARALQLGGIQIQQQQALLGMQRLNNLRQTLGGLLANPNVSHRDVVGAVSNLLALPENERPFSASVAAASLASLPQNPAEIRQWLLQHMLSTDQGIAHAQQFLPQGLPVNRGGETAFLNRDPITGTVTSAPGVGSVSNTPTAPERNAPIEDIDPNTGRPRIRPRQDALPMVDGQGRPIMPPGGEGQPRPTSPFGTGRHPSGAAPAPVQPRPAAAPATPSTPPRLGATQDDRDRLYDELIRSGMDPDRAAQEVVRRLPAGPAPQAQTGWAPGEAEAEQIAGRASAEGAATLMRTAQETRNMDAILMNLDQLVQQFASGPGADWQRVAAAAWNRHVPVRSWEFDPTRIANQEEFNKQVLSLASDQFRALGGTGTDSQLAQVLNTSPNELMTRLGNRGIISMLRGNVRALEVKAQEWQRWLSQGHGANSYGQFTTQFNSQYDPRVFQATFMTPAQRRQMWDAMSDSDKQSYRRAWSIALERGWVQLPAAAGGAPANAR